MSERTRIMTVSDGVGWDVYRVRTASSQYHLGVFPGGWGKRPCAVLRGTSQGLGVAVDVQDSAPLIGGRSLFDVDPSKWIGHAIEIGTAKTSPVRSVERERDAAIVTSITTRRTSALESGPEPTTVRASQPKKEATWAPYPEDYVERVEVAAHLLRDAYQKRELVRDLKAHPELLQRFELALAECFLMLKGIGGRMASKD